MKCDKCGRQNADNAVFCVECGNKINREEKLFCGNCGTELKNGTNFCGNCGMTIEGKANSQPTVAYIQPAPRKKSSSSVIIVILVLIIALLSAGITGYFVYNNYLENNEETVESTTRKKKKESSKEKKNEKDEEEEYLEDEDLGDPPYVVEDSYLFPSDRAYISEVDLAGLSQEAVALVRNEIYARHGYVFKSEPYKSYFESQEWYVPNEYFDETMFNQVEKANKDFIVEYEKQMGWR